MPGAADNKIMSTTLELIREIRDHIVGHSTGRLNITFPASLHEVDFSEGTIVTRPEQVLACLDEPPLAFEFVPIRVAEPDEVQSGAALLVEALESVGDDALRRIWEPYHDWTILLSEDPEIHQTPVSDHMERRPGRLRGLLRLAATGAARLEPPARRSLGEEMASIRTATARENYWEALGVDRSANRNEIRRAHRELARQFHPDRWHAAGSRVVRGEVEQAFRDVQYCYEKALAALPRQLAAAPIAVAAGVRGVTLGPDPSGRPRPAAAPASAPTTPDTPARAPRPTASAMASYASGTPGAPAPNSLFRRIFDRFFNAA